MSDLLYAAYGSNLHPHRICTRIPAATLIGKGHIDDRGLRFNKRGKDGSAKCSMVTATEQTFVAVYRIGVDDKAALDLIEGLGKGYDIAEVEVSGFGLCWTYIAMPDFTDDSLIPFSWYKQLVILGCEYHGFPQAYIQCVRNAAEKNDPLFERHKTNLDLIGRMGPVKS